MSLDGAALDPKVELQGLVLAGLAQSDNPAEARRRFAVALQICQPEFFDGEGGWQILWQAMTRYYGLVGMPPSQADCEEILSGGPRLTVDQRVEAAQLYAAVLVMDVSEARFRFACQRLMERWRDDEFAALLADTHAIHTGQWRGDAESGGFTDAVAHLRAGLVKVESLAEEVRSEGSLRHEMQDVLSRYAAAKRGERTGVLTGFPHLDHITSGLQPGDLALLCAYTSEGKSTTALNIAYHAAFVQNKRVVFGTSESSREQIRLRLVIRHSHHPKFGIPGGINYQAVRDGRLNPQGEALFRAVLEDTRSGAYGDVYIFQMPHRSTVGTLRRTAERIAMTQPVDLLIVDYLGLVVSEQRRSSAREEKDDVLVGAKQLAVDYNGGKGVPLLSPWQTSRAAWELARASGAYTKAALADTSQAEKASDLIVSLLSESVGSNVIRAQILKYRDGASNETFNLHANFEACLIEAEHAGIQTLNLE